MRCLPKGIKIPVLTNKDDLEENTILKMYKPQPKKAAPFKGAIYVVSGAEPASGSAKKKARTKMQLDM